MGLTPMMQQYFSIKDQHKDCIVFFRLGDFYEMFFEDAILASKELEVALTGRDCGLEERAPMCGIPYHSAATYINKLIEKGYKIAICEQLEEPSKGKGIVKRGITRIVTPGTYTDGAFLDENKNNFIVSLYIMEGKFGLSYADVSTGEFYSTFSNIDTNSILDEFSKINPSEILISEDIDEEILKKIKERFNILETKLDSTYYSKESLTYFSNKFNLQVKEEVLLKSASALFNYIEKTQRIEPSHFSEVTIYEILNYLSIDINSRRNLELTETLMEKSKKGSLLWVLDKTETVMGSRVLRKWVEQPLKDLEKIDERRLSVEELVNEVSKLEDLKEALRGIYDIERIVGKISTKNVNAKELISLKSSLVKIPEIKTVLNSFNGEYLSNYYKALDELKDIHSYLEKALLEDPSISLKEGNIIKEGFNEEVDKLREAKLHGKEWIANLESREREFTGIRSLKVSYNKVFGYYIEITNSNLSAIPEGRYIRKQTLSNAERFITDELKEMESKILGAEEKLSAIEYQLFVQIREAIELHSERMKKTASIVATLDCLASLAVVALENNYVKPELTTEDEIIIKEGRHPVVEKRLSSGSFVANDIKINTKDEQMLLITGPNMAGKSTYMRQVALIVIMAQIGSFVPAAYAKISLCDKIFTRIGASDDLASGKSTFMVEMWEVSNILKNATSKSLILLDEVGRGTSTFDGLSIAWSVIEYICKGEGIKCKTLFATHYHELTKLEGTIEGVKNYSVSVKEVAGEILFLRKIIKGGADQSYGIEVAKLAGLPKEVIERAKEILKKIEGEKSHELKVDSILNENNIKFRESAIDNIQEEKVQKKKAKAEKIQLDFLDIEKSNLLSDLKSIDVLNMTPMDGFNKLYEFIKRAKNIE